MMEKEGMRSKKPQRTEQKVTYKIAKVTYFNADRKCLAYDCDGVSYQIFVKNRYCPGDIIRVKSDDPCKVVGE